MKLAHIVVAGIVQGVSYRRFTENNAIKLGLKGYVKNLPDGRVEAVVEGQKKIIEELIIRLKEGPPGSKVRELKVVWHEAKNEFIRFERRH